MIFFFSHNQTLNFIMYQQYIYLLLRFNPFNLSRRLAVYKYLRFNIEGGHWTLAGAEYIYELQQFSSTTQHLMPLRRRGCVHFISLFIQMRGKHESDSIARSLIVNCHKQITQERSHICLATEEESEADCQIKATP